MTSAYIIANVDVTNPEQYEEYKKLSTIAMKAHGAESARAKARPSCGWCWSREYEDRTSVREGREGTAKDAKGEQEND